MTYRTEIHDMRSELRVLNKAIPEVAKGFAQLSKAAHDEGVLEVKHKEYVAVGIAVAQRCQPCINFHVEALMKSGGGPALMYAGHALACWDELAAPAA